MGTTKRVVVAMSGGVDSSLTAALLLSQGYEVIGMTMRLWEDPNRANIYDERACCSLSAVEDARRVADKLGIPHYVVNFRDVFYDKVVKYFIAEYKSGRTPNPCIACNRYIKFENLLKKAMELEADYVATGHYARIESCPDTGRYLLKKGLDVHKDQSYVLYHFTQQQLSKYLMPLGQYTKDQTRKMAADLQLSVANKPDSQEICFIPDDDYKSFLMQQDVKLKRQGNFVDVQGNILGRHQGVAFYTVGQRKGLGIALGKPMYVVEIRPQTNEVVLGENSEVFVEGLIADDLNWIACERLTGPIQIKAKIRYNAREKEAEIKPIDDTSVLVKFSQPERAVTPGQAVVFYDGDMVVGGGTIRQVAQF